MDWWNLEGPIRTKPNRKKKNEPIDPLYAKIKERSEMYSKKESSGASCPDRIDRLASRDFQVSKNYS